jgi:hypothetical protein
LSSSGLGHEQHALQIGFQTASFGLSTFQEFFNARDGALCDGDASFDGFVSAVEIVPGYRMNVRAQNEIGVALPAFELVFLGGADGTRDDLKDVGGRAAMSVLNSDLNTEDKFGAELSRGLGRNRGDQAAVHEAARSNIDRLEQTWESAARANRVFEVAVSQDDRLTIIKVGGNDGERDAQIFEMLGVENAIDQIAEAMVAGEAEARNAPAADVAKFQCAAGGDDARQGCAAGVSRAENAADACPRDAGNGDAVLLENLKDAEMRKSARKSAAESDADTCPTGQWGRMERFGLRFTYHGGSFAISRWSGR